MQETPKLLFGDDFLRKIIVTATGLGFAAMVGSLAALHPGETGAFQFRWHWTVGPLTIAAAILNWYFWKVIWEHQSAPTPKTKTRLVAASVLIVALGVGAFLYPIRFLAASNYGAIVRGLITAVLFLGTIGRIMLMVHRGISASDAIEMQKAGAGDSRNDAV